MKLFFQTFSNFKKIFIEKMRFKKKVQKIKFWFVYKAISAEERKSLYIQTKKNTTDFIFAKFEKLKFSKLEIFKKFL